MSIATMNWALSQRLETHQQQILLYVIADSADPNGVTRHCDPDYMADRARLSRATMFRRLGELEDIGVLSRSKFYSEHGAPIYEIRLKLEARIDVPIRKRRKGDEDDDGHDEATPESQAETLVETTKVSPEASAESHSCDSISPTLSKSLPPTPLRGGDLSKKELEQSEKRTQLWDRFKLDYPSISTMDQQAARDELDALPIDDAEWAISTLPALKADLRKANRPPKNAHIWLHKGMFRNFPRGKIEGPPPEGVWIVEGSDQDRALRFIRQLARIPLPFVRARADGSRGYLHKSDIGPDLLAMLAFANDVPLRWPKFDRGTPEFAAWQRRFSDWVDKGPPCEPGTDSIHMPCRWPPKRDGTLSPDTPSPTMTPDDEAFAKEGTR